MQSEAIENFLVLHLNKSLPAHKAVQDVYHYATLPGGKFFRPKLVWSVLSDLNQDLYNQSFQNANSDHAYLSTALELHHTYTLLHDDLPCMDNDLTRRGKPCTHIAFGEWQALLTGDGLLNISYQLMTKIKNPKNIDLLRFCSWALGPKGLIHGQVMDLSNEMTLSFQNTLRTHELKTARLIQVAILGSALLSSDQTKNSVNFKKLWKFSRLLGVNFQLIDDLSELAEKNLSEHEKKVNPWIHFQEQTYKEVLQGLIQFKNLAVELQLKETNKIINDYYINMLTIIEKNLSTININLGNQLDLIPVILLMKSFRNI